MPVLPVCRQAGPYDFPSQPSPVSVAHTVNPYDSLTAVTSICHTHSQPLWLSLTAVSSICHTESTLMTPYQPSPVSVTHTVNPYLRYHAWCECVYVCVRVRVCVCMLLNPFCNVTFLIGLWWNCYLWSGFRQGLGFDKNVDTHYSDPVVFVYIPLKLSSGMCQSDTSVDASASGMLFYKMKP